MLFRVPLAHRTRCSCGRQRRHSYGGVCSSLSIRKHTPAHVSASDRCFAFVLTFAFGECAREFWRCFSLAHAASHRQNRVLPIFSESVCVCVCAVAICTVCVNSPLFCLYYAACVTQLTGECADERPMEKFWSADTSGFWRNV